MKVKDFFFSYSQTLSFEVEKKSYFKAFRKCIYFPYKFIVNQIKIFLSIDKKKIDNNLINKNESINNLFIKFKSDKASLIEYKGKIIQGHNYSPFYEKYLNKYKQKENLKILEIGTLRGGAAASLYQYFLNPLIYCLDVNPFQTYIHSKDIRNIYCNTRSKKNINNVAKYLKYDFDIIIDDGSHNVKDQILTLKTFLPKLKKGGTYVIEDITQYKVFPELNSDGLKYGAETFLETIHSKDVKIPECISNEEFEDIKKNIKEVHFERGECVYQNINISDIAFIEK